MEEAREQVLSKNFQKEALRIFVQDCLADELEHGLILIGKQGRIWSDQPGGTKVFEEGITGMTYNPGETGGRVFYGITREEYPTEPNAFPCNNGSNSPEFCQYKYPNTQIGYGKLELSTSTLQNDLRRFLINRTTWCVENFTKTNISSEAVIETEAISLKLDILDNGINAEVDYPLKLILGKEEFFHLSEFDFFYPTQFKALLDSAVALPLRMDWKYVDFNYTKETMENFYFTHGSEIETRDCSPSEDEDLFFCDLTLFYDKYSSIGIQMKNQTLPNGDDLFIFEAAPYSILNSPEQFVYRFIRQNRPPALDYVSRLECPQADYDYLVIKGDEDLGEIDITLNAKDADEDTFSYGFELWNGFKIEGNNFKLDTKDQNLNIEKGFYDILAYVIDRHGQQDWQDVRVLVDREAELDISLNVPYKFKPSSNSPSKELRDYEELFDEDYYYISNEDPIFIELTYPSDSIAPTLSHTQVKFEYSNEDNDEWFEFGFEPTQESTNNCFSFPWLLSSNCNIDDYKSEIFNWKENLVSKLSSKPLPPPSNHFKQPTTTGKLSVSFSTEYCAAFGDSDSAEAEVIVKDCLPHVNPEYPWAFNPTGNYHQYRYGVNPDGTTNFDEFEGPDPTINPFLATHSCCAGVAGNPGSWQLKEPGEVCFINPEPGCYGGIADWTAIVPSGKKYVLEQQVDTCDGNRGNVCGGDGTKKYGLWKDELKCGSGSSCSVITACEGKPSWSYVASDKDKEEVIDAWCHGEMGCAELCEAPKEVVYNGFSTSKTFNSDDINELAKTNRARIDSGTDFSCGCKITEDAGKPCDSNFDGNFNGFCEGDTDECIGDN